LINSGSIKALQPMAAIWYNQGMKNITFKDDPELEAAYRKQRDLSPAYENEWVMAGHPALAPYDHPYLLAYYHYQDLIDQRRADGRWPPDYMATGRRTGPIFSDC
jgi:hypothetical protein